MDEKTFSISLKQGHIDLIKHVLQVYIKTKKEQLSEVDKNKLPLPEWVGVVENQVLDAENFLYYISAYS